MASIELILEGVIGTLVPVLAWSLTRQVDQIDKEAERLQSEIANLCEDFEVLREDVISPMRTQLALLKNSVKRLEYHRDDRKNEDS